MSSWLRLFSILMHVLVAGIACAGEDILYLSNMGSSTNSGVRASPLSDVPTAMFLLNAGGTIRVLDASSYKPYCYLTKSLTLEGADGIPTFMCSNAAWYAIECDGAAQSNTLRNLNVEGGAGTGGKGIYFVGKSLIMENVTVRNCSIGLDFSTANNGSVTLRNCVFENCSTAAIKSIASSTAATITLDNVRITGCGTGVDAENGTRLVIRGSDISRCVTGLAISRGATLSKAELENTTVSFNTTGIVAGSGASIVRLGNCLISNNTTGLQTTGGTIYSYGNNRVVGNASDGSAMQPIATK